MPEAIHRQYYRVTQWLILTLSSAAAVAISTIIGILPTNRVAGSRGVVALAVAALVVWSVNAIGAVPVVLSPGSDPRAALVAVQIAMLLRFMLTLAAALALALGTSLPRTPLLLWIGIYYVVVLAVTTVMEVWLLRRKRTEASV